MKQTKGYAKNNYETLRNQISSIQSMCYGVYGYRRMTAALNEKGYHVNHKPDEGGRSTLQMQK